MDALPRHGVRTAADDVGAGNAGLRLLSEVHFDIMKIDLSLVRAGAASDPADAVLRALAGLAGARARSIVAEGIETAAQLEVVLELGFGAGQGYLLRPPGPLLDAPPVDLLRLAGLRPDPHPRRRVRARRSARPAEGRQLPECHEVPGGHRVADALEVQLRDAVGAHTTCATSR